MDVMAKIRAPQRSNLQLATSIKPQISGAVRL
jgi:hypothetical protein